LIRNFIKKSRPSSLPAATYAERTDLIRCARSCKSARNDTRDSEPASSFSGNSVMPHRASSASCTGAAPMLFGHNWWCKSRESRVRRSVGEGRISRRDRSPLSSSGRASSAARQCCRAHASGRGRCAGARAASFITLYRGTECDERRGEEDRGGFYCVSSCLSKARNARGVFMSSAIGASRAAPQAALRPPGNPLRLL
jgi:hypothetical protein